MVVKCAGDCKANNWKRQETEQLELCDSRLPELFWREASVSLQAEAGLREERRAEAFFLKRET